MTSNNCTCSSNGPPTREHRYYSRTKALCPICYANCQGSDDIPLSDFKNRLDALKRVEGRMVGYTGKRITWDQAINSKQKLTLDKYSMDTNPPVMPNKEGKYDIAVPGVTPFV